MAVPFEHQPRASVVVARRWAAGPARAIAIAFVASRALLLLAAVLAETVVSRNPLLTSGSDAPILRSLTSWDGWWYLGIARDGYHAAPLTMGYHDYGFFPLYPLLVRILSFGIPGVDAVVAVLLSNALFLVALALLYRLTRDVLDEERATLACVYLCIFPFAWVFSMAYGESLFLVLSLWALLEAERGHAARASVLASLAGATRLPGVLLAVPIAIILWRRLRDRRALVWLVVVPVGAGAFLGYVAWLTGGVAGFLGDKTTWTGAAVGGAATSGPTNLGSSLDLLRLSLLVTLLAFVFLLVYLRPDRIPLAYATIPILTLLAILARGELESDGRYAMLAFPFMWTLAGRGSRAFRVAWPIVSCGLFLVLAVSALSGHAAP